MSSLIKFIPTPAAIAIHADLIREFGGLPGIRDRGLLESALTRAQQIAAYEKVNLFRMAAAYAYGIIKNHPFVDGNKRAGFIIAYVFLSLNGAEFLVPEEEVVLVISGVADGGVDETTLALWFENNSRRN